MEGLDDGGHKRHAALCFPPAAARLTKICFLNDGVCLDDMYVSQMTAHD